ncbi:MAG: hypothetical protein KDB07_00515, partial [Planctomycetes bacterium]|nr:hypothetical protein [Planctomycetota bacterium]
MKFSIRLAMVALLTLLGGSPLFAQTTAGNVALPATGASGGGGANPWGPDRLNNGDTSGTYNDCWITGGSWCEFTWTTAVKVGTMKIWYTRYRSLAASYCFHRGDVKWWDGSQYVSSHQHDDMNYSVQDDETIVMPTPVTTTKIRIENLYAGSNVMIQEW